MKPRFVPDDRGFRSFLQSPLVGAGVLLEADRAASQLRSQLPRGKTGELQDSVRVEAANVVLPTRKHGRSIRAGARIVIDSEHAAPVEYGYVHSSSGRFIPGRGIIGRFVGGRRNA